MICRTSAMLGAACRSAQFCYFRLRPEFNGERLRNGLSALNLAGAAEAGTRQTTKNTIRTHRIIAGVILCPFPTLRRIAFCFKGSTLFDNEF